MGSRSSDSRSVTRLDSSDSSQRLNLPEPAVSRFETGEDLGHHPSLRSVWSALPVLHACRGSLRPPRARPIPVRSTSPKPVDFQRRKITTKPGVGTTRRPGAIQPSLVRRFAFKNRRSKASAFDRPDAWRNALETPRTSGSRSRPQLRLVPCRSVGCREVVRTSAARCGRLERWSERVLCQRLPRQTPRSSERRLPRPIQPPCRYAAGAHAQ